MTAEPADGTDSCYSAPVCRQPLSAPQASELARILKALADPVRLGVLSRLAACDGGEVCVCDLVAAFDLSQPTISHHLRVLREAGLADSTRRGTWVYYRARPDSLKALYAALDTFTLTTVPV